MPELPDIVAYQECIERVARGEKLLRVRIYRPFLVRSVSPPISDFEGKRLMSVERLGKRLALAFDGGAFLIIHLMIAGRLHWLSKSPTRPSKTDLACFEFQSGSLLLTEAGTKRRASLHAVADRRTLSEHDRGGIDLLSAGLEEFSAALLAENRTLKRALTNPAKFSGVGNAYSDEILFAARLSPVRLTSSLKPNETLRLYEAAISTLTHWIEVLRKEFKDRFPGKGDITAFRKDFAVHGRYGKPCLECGMPIQRIVYAENETNYCARCQNEDRVLADRALSRLLKSDWPRSIEEMASD